MAFIPRRAENKPVRHTFDKKAFSRYSVRALLWPFIAFLIQLLPFMAGRKQDMLDIALKVGIQALSFAAALISFLIMFYTLKSSDVFTVPSCVLYRKRRLFTSLFDGVRYIVYHIENVKGVKGEEKNPVNVKGHLNAVYVLEDGNTIHSYKTCRKVSIPPCFTDMAVICETLESMETGAVKVEKEYLTF